ncbi:uncharacterized protein MELLADRAFT_61371 [Melampsora larici-populina 98AG31]|uniref:Uncharacterized protein n=1 Tax=Melampsora larici-populina (strain 98AG31 / pathotype 3-4-7) TaxID=747676 RepID=F4REM3_MELLP|nr:uncharacterized protein MELLADRAFT_61371 [Melampsora larici-populina 98AG31]EGG09123.1 hypothetical protein MELLADRAFT_61371 [Melampsora larici-populina 98AG31]
MYVLLTMLRKCYFMKGVLLVIAQIAGSYVGIRLKGSIDKTVELCQAADLSFQRLDSSRCLTFTLYFIAGFLLGVDARFAIRGNSGYQWGGSGLELVNLSYQIDWTRLDTNFLLYFIKINVKMQV